LGWKPDQQLYTQCCNSIHIAATVQVLLQHYAAQQLSSPLSGKMSCILRDGADANLDIACQMVFLIAGNQYSLHDAAYCIGEVSGTFREQENTR